MRNNLAKIFCLFVSLCLSFYSNAQQEDSLVENSNVMTLEEFLKIVVENHPLAKQAQFISDKGKMALRSARGSFDPKIFYSWDKKEFQSKKYYEYRSMGLTVPTWFGVELNSGLDYTDTKSKYYNPEYTTPSDGTGYVGITVPLGQDLIMDERRKTLRKAQFMQRASEFDKINAINELIYNATSQYWEWVKAYYNLKTYDSTFLNSNERFLAVRGVFLLGEAAAMDTVEAYTQVQAVEYLFLDSKIALANERLMLSNFLWDESSVPMEITENVMPQEVNFFNQPDYSKVQNIIQNTEQVVQNHPVVQAYSLKLEGLEIEQRYYGNKLLPKAKLKYNLLSKGYNTQYSSQDYKIGIMLNFPILLREQRGDYQMSKIKVQETQLAINLKQLELRNKLLSYKIKLETIAQQIQVYQAAVANYNFLLKSEEIKMFNGESSLFKVNERENKYYIARVKLNELIAKFYQTESFLIFTSGNGL